MTQKKIIAVCVVAVIVVLGLIYAFSHNKAGLAGTISTPDCSNGATSCTSGSFYAGGTITGAILQSLGALNVDGAVTFSGSNVSIGGQTTYSPKQTFTSATTTPCSILSPAATSTLVSYVSKITTGTSTASIFDVGTSTNAFATSTLNFIQQRTVASGAQDYAFFTGTTTGLTAGGVAQNTVLAPNTYVVFKTGAGLSGYTYGGTCQAVFAY